MTTRKKCNKGTPGCPAHHSMAQSICRPPPKFSDAKPIEPAPPVEPIELEPSSGGAPASALEWYPIAALVLKADRPDGRMLTITVNRGPDNWWQSLAVEGAAPRPKESTHEAVDNFLAQHAHENMKPRLSLRVAMREAEKYAKEWLAKAGAAPPCDCGDKTMGDPHWPDAPEGEVHIRERHV